MSRRTRSLLDTLKSELTFGLRNMYSNIATNIYRWSGIPEEIPSRYPEKTLYENGLCTFLEIPGAGYGILPVAVETIEKNIYGEPSSWRAVALGTLAERINSQRLNWDNSVLIYNDNYYRPTKPYVDFLIKEMVNTELAMRMNINAQKNPMWFKTNDMNVLQNKNTFIEWFEGEPTFFKTTMASDEFEFINPGIPYIANELADTYNVYHYRILGYLGLDNAGVDKKERLVVSESESNSDYINMIRNVRLEQRKTAVDRINETFGLGLSVDINEELAGQLQGTSKPGKTGDGFGEENGYNGIQA